MRYFANIEVEIEADDIASAREVAMEAATTIEDDNPLEIINATVVDVE